MRTNLRAILRMRMRTCHTVHTWSRSLYILSSTSFQCIKYTDSKHNTCAPEWNEDTAAGIKMIHGWMDTAV